MNPVSDSRPQRRAKGVASIDELGSFSAIIDVRSPAEFADDHIPGALSCPVLDNDQRAEIGTLYKQVSPFAAKKLGAAYISRNIARHIETRFQDCDRQWRPLVVCWRGGMRSGALTTVLRSIGWDACQLEGGYKAFRQHVLTRLDQLPAGLDFRLLSGPTGSAKTRILQAIGRQGGQIVDLEALACHKGSVLGADPEQPQPSQKWFETQIWQALETCTPDQPIFLEAESRKIGNLRLPEALFLAMRQSPCIDIAADQAARVDFLLEDYRHFLATPEALKGRLDTLRPLLGHEMISYWQQCIDGERYPELIAALLASHYDPLYARARERNQDTLGSLSFATQKLDSTAVDRLASEILQSTRRS